MVRPISTPRNTYTFRPLTGYRSLRLLPHDQNTGGFFVCVLQKSEAVDEELAAAVEAETARAMGRVEASASANADAMDIEQSEPNGLKRSAPSSPGSAPPEANKKAKAAGPPAKRQRRDASFKEDPFSFVDPEHEEIKRIS